MFSSFEVRCSSEFKSPLTVFKNTHYFGKNKLREQRFACRRPATGTPGFDHFLVDCFCLLHCYSGIEIGLVRAPGSLGIKARYSAARGIREGTDDRLTFFDLAAAGRNA